MARPPHHLPSRAGCITRDRVLALSPQGESAARRAPWSCTCRVPKPYPRAVCQIEEAPRPSRQPGEGWHAVRGADPPSPAAMDRTIPAGSDPGAPGGAAPDRGDRANRSPTGVARSGPAAWVPAGAGMDGVAPASPHRAAGDGRGRAPDGLAPLRALDESRPAAGAPASRSGAPGQHPADRGRTPAGGRRASWASAAPSAAPPAV